MKRRHNKMSKKIQDPFASREAENYENPIPSRELISQLLEEAPGPVAMDKIASMLQIEDDERREALRRRLRAMERDGQLISNRKREYGLTQKMDLVRGRVQGHRDGFGFVITADEGSDIYLSSRQMRKVFDGDEVLVSPGKEDFKGKREGKIVEVLHRNTTQLVGRLVSQAGTYFVRPDNPRNSHDVLVPADEIRNAEAGQFVVVELTHYPDRHQKPLGRIIEVLGDHMAPGMEIDVAIRSHGIPNTWPADVQREAANFSAEVKESDKTNRIDLRHLPFVTIDGEDARDFDDAVYCEKKKSGGWRLYVAIADVSHYVPTRSALDQEAIVRGNSVYFPDYVVPMLPQVLSNGLCSLNPKVDRLCMVCEISISARGKISGYKFFEGVMHSHARLTYTEVGHMVGEEHEDKDASREKHAAVLPHIDELYALYLTLRENREERGAIDFESNETRIVFDQHRKIKKIIPVERNDAHKLIEECMLTANVCAARFLESHKTPTLYRVHEGPAEEKVEMVQEFLGGLGLQMRGDGPITPQDYRDILEQVEGRPDAHLIQTVMLRSMNQARYQPENRGHFGLAFSAYTHFTSPIRRYPDLLVHRAIRAHIRSGNKDIQVRRDNNTPIQDFNKSYPYSTNDVSVIGEQCSTTERRADEATRDVVNWLKCEYLQDHVGETFEGVVSSVTGFGLFVELDDLFIEGLLHITSLPQDYYHFEASQHRLVGERSGKVFRIGDSVRVQIARVDLDERKIDFELVGIKHQKRSKSSGARGEDKGKKPSDKKRTIRKRKLPNSKDENKSGASARKSEPSNTEKNRKKKSPKKVASARGKSKARPSKPAKNKNTKK